MSGFLLDTNCISEVVRVMPEPRVLEWMDAADEGLLYLSVLTVGEIREGLASLPQGKRRTHLEAWLEVELQARFSGRVLKSGVRSKATTTPTVRTTRQIGSIGLCSESTRIYIGL
jgi:predicted nucleic acid-binding protein